MQLLSQSFFLLCKIRHRFTKLSSGQSWAIHFKTAIHFQAKLPSTDNHYTLNNLAVLLPQLSSYQGDVLQGTNSTFHSRFKSILQAGTCIFQEN